jgi:fructokinase
MKLKLLAFGEILWDVFGDVRHIGGATLNIAAHFSLHGGKAKIISAVGNDELGRDAVKCVRDFRIDTEHLKILDTYPTGESIVSLDSNGIPTYKITENVAYDYIDTDGIHTDGPDALYFGTLALRAPYNRESLARLIARSEFAQIFVDVNLREPFVFKESIDLALKNATILKISDEELPKLCSIALGREYPYIEAAEKIAELHSQIKLIIITGGEKGAFLLDTRTSRRYEIAAKRVDAVSTVGAGDSFSAAFLYSYLQGKSTEICLENATRVSAFVVSVPEAVPHYTPSEL